MIAVDPTSRPTFDSLLHSCRGTVFPETFYSFLHNYVASVNELSSSQSTFGQQSHGSMNAASPIVTTPSNVKPNPSAPPNPNSGDVFSEPLPSDSDHRMERIWSDYESIEPYLLLPSDSENMEETMKEPVRIEYGSNTIGAGKPFQVDTLSPTKPRLF